MINMLRAGSVEAFDLLGERISVDGWPIEGDVMFASRESGVAVVEARSAYEQGLLDGKLAFGAIPYDPEEPDMVIFRGKIEIAKKTELEVAQERFDEALARLNAAKRRSAI